MEVPAAPFEELRGAAPVPFSVEIRGRVERTRQVQQSCGYYNAHMPVRVVRNRGALDNARRAHARNGRPPQGIPGARRDRILRVSLTIADLDQSLAVSAKHVVEAVQYRSLDRNYWT